MFSFLYFGILFIFVCVKYLCRLASPKSSNILIEGNNEIQKTNETTKSTTYDESEKQVTPISSKSITYSQKSTASAQSSVSGGGKQQSPAAKSTTSQVLDEKPMEKESETMQNKHDSEVSIQHYASLTSLHSKSESIRTVLDDTPTHMSRAPSMKSLAIEEHIEGSEGSFVVVDDDVVDGAINDNVDLHDTVNEDVNYDDIDRVQRGMVIERVSSRESKSRPSTNTSRGSDRSKYSPINNTHVEHVERSPLKSAGNMKNFSRRSSVAKSMESLYEHNSIKQNSLDNTTTTNNTTTTEDTSSQSSVTQLEFSSAPPIKPQHTPLKQKSKTTHFLRSKRRISPVKQAINMQQAELYPVTLPRFEKPREALLRAYDSCDSSNWETNIAGLKIFVSLMRNNPEYLDTQMHMVCIQMTRSVRNLRSQVSRAACQAAAEFFALKSKTLEQECDDLVCALLHRTADTNRFLRQDSTNALESMCDNLSPQKILTILTTKGATHQNALVRTTAAKLLTRLAERLSCDKIYTMTRENRDKFFVTGANLLLEGSLETRSYAKELFRLLSRHPSYNRLITEVIPQRTYRNVEKTLKSIR